jgi:hypothetical protein
VVSCGQGQQSESKESLKTASADTLSIPNMAIGLPNPMQAAALLRQAGATFQPNLTHDLSQVSVYQQTGEKALNLGVYSADLAYVNAFDRKQDVIRYFDAVRKLAEGLQLGGIFNEALLKRLDSNQDNSDSLNAIAAQTLGRVRRQLNSTGQPHVEALITAGGWIEGLYLAIELYTAKPSPAVAQRIVEQKLNLDKLIELLGHHSQQKEVGKLMEGLNRLKNVYANTKLDYNYQGTQVNEKTRRVTIQATNTASIGQTEMDALRQEIKSLRNYLIGNPA